MHRLARTGELRAPSRSSLALPAVYGLAQPLFEPAHDALRERVPPLGRAAAYAVGFTCAEYASGRALRGLLGAAPWDYSHARANVHGLVRAGYLPLWGAAGLALERVHDALRRS